MFLQAFQVEVAMLQKMKTTSFKRSNVPDDDLIFTSFSKIHPSITAIYTF
jgi:hypothetical protein